MVLARVILSFLLAISCARSAAADALEDCNSQSGDADTRIAGCTAALKQEGFDNKNRAVLYLNRGASYDERGDYAEAIADATKALELRGDDYIAALENRAIAYHHDKQFHLAIADFTKVIQIEPKRASAYRGRARVYADLKDRSRSLRDYDRLIALQPENEWNWAGRSQVRLEHKDFDGALEDASKALEIGGPNAAFAFYHRGNSYLAKGDFEKAADDYTSYLELDSKYRFAYDGRAQAYLGLGKMTEALADANRALEGVKQEEENEDIGSLYKTRAEVRQAMGDKAGATADCAKAKTLDFDLSEACDAIAKGGAPGEPSGTKTATSNEATDEATRGDAWALCVEQDSEPKAGIAACEKALAARELDAKSRAQALMNLGTYHYAVSDKKAAIENYTKSIEAYPDVASVYLMRGVVQVELGDLEPARADIDKALELDDKYADAYATRGDMLLKMGKLDEALKALDKAVELEPKTASHHSSRASVFEAKGDKTSMIAEYAMAIAFMDEMKSAEEFNSRAWAKFKIGKLEEALADAERALELTPNDPNSLDTRGHIFEALGKREEAIADFRRALSKDPSIEESKKGLQRLGATP